MIGIGEYPAANIGLRQRRAVGAEANNNNNNNDTDNGQAQVRAAPPRAPLPWELQQQQQQQQQQTQQPWRTSHVYCFVSAILAILAVITSASAPVATFSSRSFNGSKFLSESSGHSSNRDSGSEPGMVPATSSSSPDAELITTNPLPASYMIDALDTDWWRNVMDFLFSTPSGHFPGWMLEAKSAESASSAVTNSKQQLPQDQNQQPWWKMSWLGKHNKQDSLPQKQQQQNQAPQVPTSWWHNWVDPSLLEATPSTITDLIDKVLTSTPRLLAIANLLLALTYQLHSFVADWFLGGGVSPLPVEWAMTGRERLGSFLVFKLLLICAVVSPDTLDWLILLSWYTLLSFLRSLAHLAAATTSHTTQSGQPPRSGVLQLLLVVLLCDFLAAAVCVALFQLAGVGMVVLLTCDCALLAVEVLGHVLKHVRQVLEDMHEHTISEMEEQQVDIHTRQRRLEEQLQERRQQQRQQQGQQQPESGINADAGNIESTEDQNPEASAIADGWDPLDDLSLDDDAEDEDDGIRTQHRNNRILLMEDSRRLDQAMDVLELAHTRRLAILDTTIFGLQLLVHAITVGHFLHIWTLHGIQFTLIDGVLALHLHSALSAASKQIAERRNLHRIARNLDGMFPNASELDLKLAHASGDVCCICLGTMSVGSVKKVGCGHLYHTSCLREVIERAHAIESARCPLCRASIVDGSHATADSNTNDPDQAIGRAAGENDNNANNVGNNNGGGNNPENAPILGRPNDALNQRGERALFRFSTEGILPTWMPLPAFSFEVVRRPTRQEQPANNNNNTNQGGRMLARNNANANNDNNARRHPQQQQTQRSFLRRLLLLAGALPMSPEEEARALAQLVDMFPQYDRADLLRELRDRGSAEAVVESVLLGVFQGRVRGSAGGEAAPATANNRIVGNNNGGEETVGSTVQANLNNRGVDPPAQAVPNQIQ